MHSYAHFAGTHPITSHSHSKISGAVSHNYNGSWIVDTGASDHMTSNLNQLKNLKPLPPPITITLPNGSLKNMTQVAQVHIPPNLTLHNVLHVFESFYL